MKTILEELKPDAVFCANDYMAAGAIKFLWETGLRVPQDISVVGYDNNDICEAIIPSLTTVDHRLEELGQCLAQGLLALIEGAAPNIRKPSYPVSLRGDRMRHTLLGGRQESVQTSGVN
jgi:DNA-binding LacI/PurR family transcriptional regulator